jgi:hypothetical protein
MAINTVMCVRNKERYARYVYMGKKPWPKKNLVI